MKASHYKILLILLVLIALVIYDRSNLNRRNRQESEIKQLNSRLELLDNQLGDLINRQVGDDFKKQAEREGFETREIHPK